jgi:hypothetical protein
MRLEPVYEAVFSPVRTHSHNAAHHTETGGSPRNPQPYHYKDLLKND